MSLWLSQVEGTRAKALREGSEHGEEGLRRAGLGAPCGGGGHSHVLPPREQALVTVT